ncbi:class I SAM-dependent methyltransferase [Pseudarthrobacter sp. NamE5]|uniref:class I SAM-dependent methyltransferase n=1 Tax=Pseudarthrobacter sp. NamE5 TaxID=2576839 RepID=UPI00110B996D|nr:class I SAM-dependent methyltransferase [Pseudarthrobacter sp. NamE5]TLM86769.1 methyltransferase domain-containing protein [Pseudarthrobacter sp. NamE5]
MVRGGPKLDHGRRQELGRSFQDGGEHYQRVRPGYPAESAQWLVPPGARDALDVGAGTGKFTELLLGQGLSVTAIDPSADMLGQLEAHCPAATAVMGTAEETGLPEAAFDVATVAQAWHWCDALRASTELARVLRPQGALGLVWNQLDTSVPWVHRLSRIMHAGDVYKPGFRPLVGPEFEGLESHVMHWQDTVTSHDLMELTKSRSYYLRASETTRAKVLANLNWYLHEHLGHAPGEKLQLPYLTLAWRAVKA